jgi:hypothetical protein
MGKKDHLNSKDEQYDFLRMFWELNWSGDDTIWT